MILVSSRALNAVILRSVLPALLTCLACGPAAASLLTSLFGSPTPALTTARKEAPIETILPNMPMWEPFYTPYKIKLTSPAADGTVDFIVYSCEMDWERYYNSPHDKCFYTDLVQYSNCNEQQRQRVSKLSSLVADLNSRGARSLEPTGFIFHEGRCGSTLVSNLLAKDPFALVYVESPMFLTVLHDYYRVGKLTKAQAAAALRDLMRVMGASPYHKRMFFKFFDTEIIYFDLLLNIFPDTPWVFVYREPVQTIMSNSKSTLGPSAVFNGVCFRNFVNFHDKQDTKIAYSLGLSRSDLDSSNLSGRRALVKCAIALRKVCVHAVEAYGNHSKFMRNGKLRPRGILINYDSLPGIIPRVVLPLFNVKLPVDVLDAMKMESFFYSKTKYHKAKIVGGYKEDSAQKELSAHESNVEPISNVLLKELFDDMVRLSLRDIKEFNPKLYIKMTENGFINWNFLKFHFHQSAYKLNRLDDTYRI